MVHTQEEPPTKQVRPKTVDERDYCQKLPSSNAIATFWAGQGETAIGNDMLCVIFLLLGEYGAGKFFTNLR